MLFSPNPNICHGLTVTTLSLVTLDLPLLLVLQDMEYKSLLIPIITEMPVKNAKLQRMIISSLDG